MNTFTVFYEAQSPKEASNETPTKTKKTKHPSSKKKKRKVRGASATKQKQKQKLAVGGGEIDSLENPAKKMVNPFAGNNKTSNAPQTHLDGNNLDAVLSNREQNIISDTESEDCSSKSYDSKRSNGSERSRVLRKKMSDLLEIKNNIKQRSNSSIAACTNRNGRVAKQQQNDDERTKKKSSTKSKADSDQGLKYKKKKTRKKKKISGSKKSKIQNNLHGDATLIGSNLEICRAWWADGAEQPQMPRRGPYRSGDRIAHRRYSQYKEDEDLPIDLSKLMDMLSN